MNYMSTAISWYNSSKISSYCEFSKFIFICSPSPYLFHLLFCFLFSMYLSLYICIYTSVTLYAYLHISNSFFLSLSTSVFLSLSLYLSFITLCIVIPSTSFILSSHVPHSLLVSLSLSLSFSHYHFIYLCFFLRVCVCVCVRVCLYSKNLRV